VYANRFLMKKRNREFGIYLILGMKKGDIAKILFGETLLVGAVSLTAGLLLGIGLSQFMSLLVAHMFEADMGRFVFTVSIPAIGKTILYFVIIYVIVILMDTVLIMKTEEKERKGPSEKSGHLLYYICSSVYHAGNSIL